MIGRFQPLHNGHVRVMLRSGVDVVCIIDGKRDSRGFLTLEEREKIFHKTLPHIKIVTAKTGYIPDIIDYLRNDGINISKVVAGEDRAMDYRRQCAQNNGVKVLSVSRGVKSIENATAVRLALDRNDFKAFRAMVPESEWNDFSIMRAKLMKTIKK